MNLALIQEERHGLRLLSALAFMMIGALVVISSVLIMNTYIEKQEVKDRGSNMTIEMKPQNKPKPKKALKKPKPKAKPKRSPVPPPPAGLNSAIGGNLDIGFALGEMGLGNDILGDMQDVTMTEDTVDVLPRPSKRAPLSYPSRARNKGITGYVKFNLLINDQGNIEQIKILESSPTGVFDQVASESIRNWSFNAAQYQGKAVRVWASQTIRFDLN